MTMTLKEYLTPQTSVRPPMPTGECWAPPAKSRGLRHFKFANKGSARGVAIIDDACVESESLGERNGTLVLWARPDTVRVVEQSPQVEYVDADGVVRVHTFDLTVFRTDGTKVAVDFKPAALVKRSGVRELHALISPQMSPRTADELLVMTERMYTRDDVFNATLMHTCARQADPRDDATIIKLVARMKGPAPIADLVKKSKLKSYGFGAVVRAISAGHLRTVEHCRIDYPVLVEPVREKD
ncbi:hypothetical protein ABH973_005938 [Bradyrhizobium ottawaense]|uniref:hypothetical protein n=1 Tax=Bradyrhizobium ottawaense TaxID=931866 RepID=UPI003510F2B8